MKQPLKEIRICFVGDSFVNGTGDPDCLGWTGRICTDANQKGFEITYYNLGVRGETSTDLKKRWFSEVSYRLPKQYDGRVVFSFGTNDTTLENGLTRVNLTDSIANARHILTQASQLYPVLMVSPPPIADNAQNVRIINLSQQFVTLCQEINVPYLDVFAVLKDANIWIDEVKNNDGAHPRAAGYELFAQIVQNWDAWQSWFC